MTLAAATPMTPIERHHLLSDQRALALTDEAGSVVWCCAPRGDSPPLFAHLLDEQAGVFTLRGPGKPTQRYDGDSWVLRTEWPSVTVIDYLDTETADGTTVLHRVVEGTGELDVTFAPRLDFGRTATRLAVMDDGLSVVGSAIHLSAPGIAWTISDDGNHQTARATMKAPASFQLVIGDDEHASARSKRLSPEEERRRRSQAKALFSDWAAGLTLPDVAPDVVRRSALVLKALIYRPTHAAFAAATTSLPETLGGVRNWDYRYCWPRDSALAMSALARLGATAEGIAFLDWVADRVQDAGSARAMLPLYTVDGKHPGGDVVVEGVRGYGSSAPVRTGNDAADQSQIDVLGPIAELIAVLHAAGAPLRPTHFALLDEMVDSIADGWNEPGHGIWELRMKPQHHTYSRTMCWLAVDAALSVLGEDAPAGWRALRDQIADDVAAHAYDDAQGAFVGAYGSPYLDAAVLRSCASGLLPADDPRLASTVDAIVAELKEGPTVYRYLMPDGLPGREGGFHICTSWLIDALIRLGRADEAQALFGELIALRGPTGLLSEQYDPQTGRALGNHPQAYSHLAVIDNAVRLSAAGVRDQT